MRDIFGSLRKDMPSHWNDLRRRRWVVRLWAAEMGISCALGVVHAAGQEKPKIKLADVAWLQGDWRADAGGDQLQEFWAAPIGDCMVGMFRWVKKDGKVSFFELLTIVDEGGEITYRFRHFGRDMKAWEEKDAPLTFKLSRADDRELVFENPNQPNLTRLTYKKTGDDAMTVLLEGKDGAPKEFHFKRK